MELLKEILEAKSMPLVVLGSINALGDIFSRNAYTPMERHPQEWYGSKRWRFMPEDEYLTWWEKPDKDEELLVKDYLSRKGYNVTYTGLMGLYETSEEVRDMLKEGIKEQAALDYLMNLVKSGPYKGKVFLAGGAVRDMELGKDPKDLDVVVLGGIDAGMNFAKWATQTMGNYDGPAFFEPFPQRPDISVDNLGEPASKEDQEKIDKWQKDVDAWTKKHKMSNPVIFPTFGTAKFTLKGITHNGVDLSDIDVEAVATRKEKYSAGSRKPEVSAGDLEDDVNRRDFTINSLLKDLTSGEILDLTGKGREDISRGIVRTPLNPDIIFSDDPLRMLRAVRFTVKYDWDLPMFMIKSIKRNADKLKTISAERIRDELNKMLVTSSPGKAVKLLKTTGLLKYVIPELLPAVKMTQNVHHKHDVFHHTLDVLKNTQPDLIQRLMALFHDIGKTVTRSVTPTGVHFYGHEDASEQITDSVMRRLKYPTELIDAVKAGVKNHMRLKQAGDTGINISDKALRKFKVDMGSQLENTLNLMHADNIAHSEASSMPNQIDNIRKRLTSLDVNLTAGKPKLPINGNDLLQLGLKPGPIFTEILKQITDAWYDNPNLTRNEALEIAKRIANIQESSDPTSLKSLMNKDVVVEDDKEDFLKHHYTGYIPSHAYNDYKDVKGLSWLGKKSLYPKVIHKGRYGPYDVEFRKDNNKLKYLKRDADGKVVKNANGEAEYMTPQDIQSANLPDDGSAIVAFVDDTPVGFASNEFGAVGVWVAEPYQKFGIGTDLLDFHMGFRPDIHAKKGKIGQMTVAGQQLAKKYYDKMEKRHGKEWFDKWRKGLLTEESVESIWIGTVVNGDELHIERENIEYAPGHEMFRRLGYFGNEFRWREDSNTIFWHKSPKTSEKKVVNRWMERHFSFTPEHMCFYDLDKDVLEPTIFALHYMDKKFPLKFRRIKLK